MAGVRTAPAVDGTPPYQHIAFTFIDASGDIRTISGDFDPEMTAAEIETLAVTLQVVTQASLFKIEVTAVYAGAAIVGNATSDQRSSVYDQVVSRAKNPSLNIGYSWQIPAPITALFVGNTDQVLATSVPLLNTYAALGAGKAGYGFVSVRYTERSEINQAQRL